MTNPMKESWAVEILHQLDEQAEAYNFPILNNIYSLLADIRLTAFRSPEEWLIIFEEVKLFKQSFFMNAVYAYGNKVTNPGLQLGVDTIISPPVTGTPIWDDQGQFQLHLLNFKLRLNGKAKELTYSPADYASAGIDLHSPEPDAAKLLRMLTRQFPDEFFLSDQRLLEICDRPRGNLKKFIQLDDWHHPNVVDDQMPGGSPCFRSLAEALARDDLDWYNCPQESHNTNWSNWQMDMS